LKIIGHYINGEKIAQKKEKRTQDVITTIYGELSKKGSGLAKPSDSERSDFGCTRSVP